ncbi:HNH endonuclease [Planctomycetota bacterium]
MPILTKVNICFSLWVPTILVRIAVWIVLVYRRVRYGYRFRRIRLTRGKYAIVDAEDFEGLNEYKWHCTYHGYATRIIYKETVKGKKAISIYMHRLLCPAPEGMIVDHINRNSLDNRKVNLRAATQKQNVWNRKFLRRRGKSQYNGIRWDNNREKWQVRLMINGQRKSFGYYADEIEAAKVYDRAAKKYRGEYAYLNFPKK